MKQRPRVEPFKTEEGQIVHPDDTRCPDFRAARWARLQAFAYFDSVNGGRGLSPRYMRWYQEWLKPRRGVR